MYSVRFTGGAYVEEIIVFPAIIKSPITDPVTVSWSPGVTLTLICNFSSQTVTSKPNESMIFDMLLRGCETDAKNIIYCIHVFSFSAKCK